MVCVAVEQQLASDVVHLRWRRGCLLAFGQPVLAAEVPAAHFACYPDSQHGAGHSEQLVVRMGSMVASMSACVVRGGRWLVVVAGARRRRRGRNGTLAVKVGRG